MPADYVRTQKCAFSAHCMKMDRRYLWFDEIVALSALRYVAVWIIRQIRLWREQVIIVASHIDVLQFISYNDMICAYHFLRVVLAPFYRRLLHRNSGIY